jgi:hypothetical protein
MKSIKSFESSELKFNLNSIYGGRKLPTHTQRVDDLGGGRTACTDTFDEYNTFWGTTNITSVKVEICC